MCLLQKSRPRTRAIQATSFQVRRHRRFAPLALLAMGLAWGPLCSASLFTVGVANSAPVPPGSQISSPDPLSISLPLSVSNPGLGSGSGVASASTEAGAVRGALDLSVTGTDLQGFEADVTASFYASMLIDDIIISGPGISVMTNMIIDFDGTVLASDITTGRSFGATATLSGPDAFSPLSLVTSSVGFSGTDSISMQLITAIKEYAVNVPLSALVILTGQASVGACCNQTTTLLADFSQTAQFAGTGPVFNLPDGFTVNSVSGGIVDNRYVGVSAVPVPATVPATLWLLASGLVGVFSYARRQEKIRRVLVYPL